MPRYKAAVIVSNLLLRNASCKEVQLVQKLIYIIARTFMQVCCIPQWQTALKKAHMRLLLFLMTNNCTARNNTVDRQRKSYDQYLKPPGYPRKELWMCLEEPTATAVCSMYRFFPFFFFFLAVKGVPLWGDSKARRKGGKKKEGWREVKERNPHPSLLLQALVENYLYFLNLPVSAKTLISLLLLPCNFNLLRWIFQWCWKSLQPHRLEIMCMRRTSTLHNSQITTEWFCVSLISSNHMRIPYIHSITVVSELWCTLGHNFCVKLKEKLSAQLQSSPLHSCGGCGYTPTSHAFSCFKPACKTYSMMIFTQNTATLHLNRKT